MHLKTMPFSNMLMFKRKERRLIETKPNRIFPPIFCHFFQKRNGEIIAWLIAADVKHFIS